MHSLGDLYFWTSGAVSERLVSSATAMGLRAQAFPGGVRVSQGDPATLRGLCEALSPDQRKSARVLVQPAGVAPGPSDFGRVDPVERLLGQLDGSWLQAVLDEDRLEPWYQPIVDALEPQRIVAHEALIRGRTTEGGLIGPWPLFSAARRSEMLVQLDLAARAAAIDSAEGLGEGLLFLNVAPPAVHAMVDGLFELQRRLRDRRIRPQQVVLEMTEADHITDVGALKAALRRLREAGFRVALDDLGAGFASLNLLHQLDPDIVKLDMALVRDVETSLYKQQIAEALITMARRLGTKTVAEGVESASTFRWLQARGVDLIQGYLLAKPQPKLLDGIHCPDLTGGGEPLIQLVYASAGRGITRGSLDEILEASRSRNARKDLSGVLLFVEGSFFQVLEGPESAVRQTYERIRRDPRHHRMLKLIERPIAQRLFSHWSMGIAELSRSEAQQIPGMNAFFSSRRALHELDESQARTLIEGFLEGRYRRAMAREGLLAA